MLRVNLSVIAYLFGAQNNTKNGFSRNRVNFNNINLNLLCELIENTTTTIHLALAYAVFYFLPYKLLFVRTLVTIISTLKLLYHKEMLLSRLVMPYHMYRVCPSHKNGVAIEFQICPRIIKYYSVISVLAELPFRSQ